MPQLEVQMIRNQVLVADAALLDFNATHVRKGGGTGARARRAVTQGMIFRSEVLPVALAGGVLDQAQVEPVDLNRADFQFLVKQRQQLHPQIDSLHRSR